MTETSSTRTSSRRSRVSALERLSFLRLSCFLLLGTVASQQSGTGARAQHGEPPGLPTPEASFDYRLTRTVDQGRGTYAGYRDSLVASGRYAVRTDGDELHIDASYRWRYQGERCEDGEETRSVRAGVGDRRYRGRTDLDEYDDTPPETPLGVWMWIPPLTPDGASVRILEHEYVVDREAEVEIAGTTRPAIAASAHGTGLRNDAYGRFRTSWNETYFFDPETGFVLRVERSEVDDNDEAGFDVIETLQVTQASYLPPELGSDALPVARCPEELPVSRRSWLDEPETLPVRVVAGALALLAVGYLWLRRRRTSSSTPLVAGMRVKVERIAEPDAIPSAMAWIPSPIQPFVPSMLRAAVRAGDTVALARREDGAFVGAAILEPDGGTTAIFAEHGDVCEILRRDLRVLDFFTDHRHQELPSVVEASNATFSASSTSAYNEAEVWEVWVGGITASPSFDTARVRRARDADTFELGRFTREVLGRDRSRLLEAIRAEDGVVLVALDDGRIVGLAVLTVVDAGARLAQWVVAPHARGRGFGAELLRAALHHASALGAKRFVCELPPEAVGARALLDGIGLRPVGSLYVESARPTRPHARPLWR